MAWQTPKTDWGAADGVRNTDINRIEGNILELYNTESLKNTLLVHVSTTGNDTTGNGTSVAPFKTITKALSTIPKNLNGKNASITIAAGTYSEDVNISGFSGGAITLTGVTNAAITLTSLTISQCICKTTTLNITTTGTIGVAVIDGATFISAGTLTCTGTAIGIRVTRCSRLYRTGTSTINNAATAVEVADCSQAYISTATISNVVTTGLSVSTGSILGYSKADNSAKTAMLTSTGGRIYTGAQSNAPVM